MVTMYSDGITIIVSLVDVPFYKNAGYTVVAEKPEEVEPVESEEVEPVETPKRVSKK